MSPVKSPEDFAAPAAGEGDKIVDEKDEVEELLPGWTKEVKVRKTGSATKIDRFYTDPVTGYIFRSLKDAQRYLKTGEIGRLAIKPKMKETEEPSKSKEQMSETMRHKRAPTDKSDSPARSSKRLAGINTDAVIPPPSPALSQPKTRQATRLAGVTVDAPPPSSPPQPKTRQAIRLAEVAVNASLPSPSPLEPKTHQATRLAVTTIDAPPSPSPSPALSEPKTHQTIRRAEVAVDASVLSPAAPKTRQAARQAASKIDSPPPDSETSQAALLTGTEMGPSPPSQPEPRTRQAKRVSGIRDNASPASPPQPKTRRATRLAGIEINSSPPSPPDTRYSRQATRTRMVSSDTPKENDNKTRAEKITDKQESNEQQELQNRLPLVTPEEHNKEIKMGPTTSASLKDQAPPTVVLPPVSLEKQKLPVVNPAINNSLPQDSYGYGTDMKADSSINFSMNDLWTDPCIEFAVKTLTGAIPFTDLNKVENLTTTPLQVPVEELWTDPCIEFAVKTLTGAIPVCEDDYLPTRPASSTNPQVPHHFSSTDAGMNFRQTDVLSKHYETGNKNKQHDSVSPTLGNNGLQMSGKFVNGSNGQCSRSRFFQ